jgi:glycosyltransferase involved in cell wall biosynthesis
MPTLIQVVHGYPPRELAGTEIYAQRLTRALSARGWTVHVVAATRSPGREHAQLLEEELDSGGRLVRVVNNLPWRPLSQREKDPLLEGRVRKVIHDLAPDLVHVQHLLFLSAHLPLKVPTVATLHDAWAWCPRGGTLLLRGEEPCPGPEESRCPSCYGDFARGSATEHRLGQVAGLASRLVAPEHLHRAWKRLPSRVRALTRGGPPPPVRPGDLEARQRAVRRAFQRMDRLLAPSSFLAEEASARGLGQVHVHRHGVPMGPPRRGDGPLVFLGSLVPHKGAHLVAEACARRGLELEIWGPGTDASYAAGLPNRKGPCPPERVPALLAGARALVMGSTWPENAPLVAIEARASGCPVLAPDIGGLKELVEPGVDGWLYEAGSVEDLVRVLGLLDHPFEVRPPPSFEQHLEQLLEHYEAVR